MRIAPIPPSNVIRSALLATGAEALISRSAAPDRIFMKTAALAVGPTVSRAHAACTSIAPSSVQEKSETRGSIAKAECLKILSRRVARRLSYAAGRDSYNGFHGQAQGDRKSVV